MENHRACRINEWSCLVEKDEINEIINKTNSFFGNMDDDADIVAFGLSQLVELGYDFTDPFPNLDLRKKFYSHGWNGVGGHSVWVKQGNGKSIYDRDKIKKLINKEFDFLY